MSSPSTSDGEADGSVAHKRGRTHTTKNNRNKNDSAHPNTINPNKGAINNSHSAIHQLESALSLFDRRSTRACLLASDAAKKLSNAANTLAPAHERIAEARLKFEQAEESMTVLERFCKELTAPERCANAIRLGPDNEKILRGFGTGNTQKKDIEQGLVLLEEYLAVVDDVSRATVFCAQNAKLVGAGSALAELKLLQSHGFRELLGVFNRILRTGSVFSLALWDQKRAVAMGNDSGEDEVEVSDESSNSNVNSKTATATDQSGSGVDDDDSFGPTASDDRGDSEDAVVRNSRGSHTNLKNSSKDRQHSATVGGATLARTPLQLSNNRMSRRRDLASDLDDDLPVDQDDATPASLSSSSSLSKKPLAADSDPNRSCMSARRRAAGDLRETSKRRQTRGHSKTHKRRRNFLSAYDADRIGAADETARGYVLLLPAALPPLQQIAGRFRREKLDGVPWVSDYATQRADSIMNSSLRRGPFSFERVKKDSVATSARYGAFEHRHSYVTLLAVIRDVLRSESHLINRLLHGGEADSRRSERRRMDSVHADILNQMASLLLQEVVEVGEDIVRDHVSRAHGGGFFVLFDIWQQISVELSSFEHLLPCDKRGRALLAKLGTLHDTALAGARSCLAAFEHYVCSDSKRQSKRGSTGPGNSGINLGAAGGDNVKEKREKMPADGTVAELCANSTAFIRRLCEVPNVLVLLRRGFVIESSTSSTVGRNGAESLHVDETIPEHLGSFIVHIVNRLLGSLRAIKLPTGAEPVLGIVFLMNNVRYVKSFIEHGETSAEVEHASLPISERSLLHRAAIHLFPEDDDESEVRVASFLDQEQLVELQQELDSALRNQREAYDAVWEPVLLALQETEDLQAKEIKRRLSSFNAAFPAAIDAQRPLRIVDESLRSALREKAAKRVAGAFEAFLESIRDVSFNKQEKNRKKYIRYDVGAVERDLTALFSGETAATRRKRGSVLLKGATSSDTASSTDTPAHKSKRFSLRKKSKKA